MHRLPVTTAVLQNDTPLLSKEAACHLKVIRPKDGEEIELFDGEGAARVYRYEAGAKALVASGELRRFPRPSALTLFACVTKGSRWDWTIEKATELGVTRIVPVISERTIVRIGADEREAKRERWRRIAEEAARQSDAKWIPEIVSPVSFAESLELVKATKCLVGALTTPPPVMIGECEGNAVYVGPEGDFAPGELAALLELAVPVSFGSTILRAETAAIYGISVLKAKLDVQSC